MNRPMRTATSDAARLRHIPGGGWWWHDWGGARMTAGITDRGTTLETLLTRFPPGVVTLGAEQIHGASLALVGGAVASPRQVAGCDALMTRTPGVVLTMRTADCLPIFFADLDREAVGLAHVGWRGLAASLPARMVAAFHHAYQSASDRLTVAIGPAIRACCYEVGPEFAARFGPFVRMRGKRRTCDLIGAAIAQLVDGGVPRRRILDCGRCTGCETERWFSLRREGQGTGRMTSLIMLR